MNGASLMTEAKQELDSTRPTTAGGLLKQARQAKGLHIAALAASIKVAQRKLESLEADRFNELPDATFTRALAQTVCRSLKIDAAPVLALLPPASGARFDQMGEGINAPFRDRPGRGEPTDWARVLASPAIWGPALVLIAAAGVYFLPSSFLSGLQFNPKSTAPVVATKPAAAVAAAAAPASTAIAPLTGAAPASAPTGAAVETVFSAPPLADTASAAMAASAPISIPVAAISLPAAPVVAGELLASTDVAAVQSASAAGGALQLRASAESWIEVQDAKKQMLLSRMLLAGETVRLDGELPLRLKVGNASGTEVVFRGQSVNLVPATVGNIARLELK
jgi:cytoskeleton protein RodZ